MSDPTREAERSAFLENCSVPFTAVNALPADASFRRYFRLQGADPEALLMDAPPPQENVHPFVEVASHLRKLGLSAPEIYDADLQRGFLVLEDFGSDTYTRLLQTGADEAALYELAIDTLVALHNNPRNSDIDLPRYNAEVLVREAMLLVDWYLPEFTGRQTPPEVGEAYRAAWESILAKLPDYADTLVLRDFHVDNLMRLQGLSGVAACGLLDFQDALIGPAAYDVASLLEDARRDIAPELVSALLNRYRAGTGLNEDEYRDFLIMYRVLAAQRHCKVLGIFVRLWRRDGKDAYLDHLPRVARLLRGHLDIPELAPLASWVDSELPDMRELPYT
jgi:aminoglycoside/choline kinase family phosphotransferase